MENREDLIKRVENLESSPEMSNPEFRSEVESLKEELGLNNKSEVDNLKDEITQLRNEIDDIKIDRLYDNIEDDSNEDYVSVVKSHQDLDEDEEESKGGILSTILLALLGILLLAGLVFGIYRLFFADNTKNKLENEVFNSSELFLNKNYENGIEYGEGEISSKQLLDLSKYGEINIVANPATIDTNEVGTKTIEYTISKGKESRTLTKDFEIKDTVIPEISGVDEKLQLTPNSEFNLEDFIKNLNVSDPVDGVFEQVEEEPTKNENGGYNNGWYTVKSNVDTTEESTYNITIHAVDKNGNTNDMVIPVKVSIFIFFINNKISSCKLVKYLNKLFSEFNLILSLVPPFCNIFEFFVTKGNILADSFFKVSKSHLK